MTSAFSWQNSVKSLPCFIPHSKAKFACYSRCFLTSYFRIPVPECKSRKSRNTWNNRQIWPWSTEWSRAKANRDLPREHTDYSKNPLPITQEKTLHMDITRWSILKSDWLYSLQPKWRSSIQSTKTRLGGSWLWLRSWTPYYQIQTEIEESKENH